MLKRYTCLLLTLALFCAYSSYSFGQDAEKPAANNDALSLDGLMVDDPAPKSEPIKIDQELLNPPKNASVDELFEFIENLQDKLPEPKTQDDFIKIIDAYSQACLNVSELVLQKDELEPEQRERAVQLKVVALTTRMKTDPAAEAQLDQFVKENLDSAKSDEELIKAYQLKLQVLASKSDDLDEISAFADELYSKEKDELKVFAIEVKAQVFITGLQKDNEPNMKVLEFVDSVIADKNVAKRVKEKAYEMKLVGTIVLAQLQEDKEEADRDPKYEQEKEELFAKLLSDPEASIELKKDVYQLRVQTLFDQSGAITDDNESKIVDVAAKLLKEEDPELYLLGVAVKGRLLITKAQGNKDAVKELADFVDELNKIVEDKEDIKSQVVALNIQLYRLQQDTKGLLAYVDAQLKANPDDELKERLTHAKASIIAGMISEDPSAFDANADFIKELAETEGFEQDATNLYISRFTGVVSKLATNNGSLDDFNAAYAQFEKDLIARPDAVRAIIIVRDEINQLGEKNNQPNLYIDTITKLANFCKGADSDELNEIGQSLDGLKRQLEAEPKDDKAETKDAPDAKDANAAK